MRNIESVKQELKAEITIGNMKNILPIIRKSAETMELIKSRLTGEREKDNQMILDTVKEIIENENRTEMF
ncbi:hypothetical protein, partial [Desulfofalx alkaliphila]|uniref:hypothetical protein n=1 Tax=Desulfofalx alkaliphila TaxID=105483 RepID=UPI0004E17B1B